MAKKKHSRKSGKRHSRAMTAYKHRSNPPVRHSRSGLASYSMSSGGKIAIFQLPSAGHAGGAAIGEILVPMVTGKVAGLAANVPVLSAIVTPGTIGYALFEALVGTGVAGLSHRVAPKASEAISIVAAGRLAAHLAFILTGGKAGMSAYLSGAGMSAYLSRAGATGRLAHSRSASVPGASVPAAAIGREV